MPSNLELDFFLVQVQYLFEKNSCYFSVDPKRLVFEMICFENFTPFSLNRKFLLFKQKKF